MKNILPFPFICPSRGLMIKIRYFTPILFCLIPGLFFAQSVLYIRNGCAINDAEMNQNHYLFDPSDEAQRIIKTIMETNFLDPNFVIKSGDVENAIATIENGQRYIIYNTTYIERIKRSGGSDWPAFFVFTHEIGHHLSNHHFDLNDDVKSKEQELKADIFAGGMLYRLGATLDQAQEGIGGDFKESGSRTHPPRKARLEAIASGWKIGYDQTGGIQPGNFKVSEIKISESKKNELKDPDKDGIEGIDDNCPYDFGPNCTSGCPDSDGDCISDKVDQCPALRGAKITNGCPEVQYRIKNKQEFIVRFDNERGGNYLGNFIPSKDYKVQWRGDGYSVTGPNKGKGGSIHTDTYKGGNPYNYELNLWGGQFKFNEDKQVMKDNRIVGVIIQ